MSKKLKAVLSFALALVLVMSLGVSAFADSSNAETEKEKEPEIVQIAFNLGTMEPCAVRMRELGYDDIRIDGVSYRADAKDGVIAINLGDLAAIKLLRENTEKAGELGIDYANLYIRGGKVLVKDDTGLTSDQIAALQQAVASLMSSVRVGVNIGDIFDLSNGEKVKLRVQVSNFIYPPAQKSSAMPVKAVDEKTADKWEKAGKADTPTITTVYVYYYGEIYDHGDEVARDNTEGYVGIAKAANDKNEYSIKICYDGKEEDAKWEDAGNIAEKKGLEKNAKSFWDETEDTGKLAKKILLSTDKGKTTFRTITLVNKTPTTDELRKIVDEKDIEKAAAALKELGYTLKITATDTVKNYEFIPINSATVIGETDEPSKVELRDKVNIKIEEPSKLSAETDKPVTLENKDAAPVAVAEAPAEHEHVWDDGVVTVAATCTEVGVMTHTCECGETMTKEIPALGHVFDENGLCTVCGASAAPVEEPKEEPENEEPKVEEPKEETPENPPVPEAPETPVTQPTVDPKPIVVETPVQPEPTVTEPAPAPVAEPAPPVEPAPETEPAE